MVKTENGWRFLHRVVMEEQLGRFLRPDERVRIKNGDKDDLRPENLVLEVGSQAAITNRKTALERKKRKLEWKIRELSDELERTLDALAEVNASIVKSRDHWQDRAKDLA
jgi:hypothetical protein